MEVLSSELKTVEKNVEELRDEMHAFNAVLNKGKGVVLVLLVLGGVIGWIASLGSHITQMWPFAGPLK